MKEKNKNLTAEQKLVLFEEGTEPPGSSELNNEKREGSYYCVNCDTKLFDSKCNCYEGYRLRFNNTNFKVENEIARITPYALTNLTHTDNPNNNKTFLSHTNNKFRYNIRWYLENILLKKYYDKNWKIM